MKKKEPRSATSKIKVKPPNLLINLPRKPIFLIDAKDYKIFVPKKIVRGKTIVCPDHFKINSLDKKTNKYTKLDVKELKKALSVNA